jgi:hypothetical protein
LSVPARRRWVTLLCGSLVAAALGLVAGCGGEDNHDPGVSDSSSATSPSADGAEAKAAVRTAVTAIETYATEHGGTYDGATVEALQQIVPDTPADLVVAIPSPQEYELSLTSESGITYVATKSPSGTLARTCAPVGEDDCPASGAW